MMYDDKTLIHYFNNHQDRDAVIHFVDHLIQEALDKHVSDIHLEPYENHYRIRFRQDGLLYEVVQLAKHFSMPITTRIKIMANLNIAEHRLPQDGRIKWNQSNNIDIRVSTCPILFGEKIVLRILNNAKFNLDIALLGLTPTQEKIFLSKLKQPQGLILVTGPTGSGKTMTLYAALHYLNRVEKNICTVEDPVEIELRGINQINVHQKIGFDFACALRAILRQDPEVIMIGEIRDSETAKIAMQAAQTGHLVLSTLHTNSAAETLMRLQSIGIQEFEIMNAISLIISQRLIRKLCHQCKKPSLSHQQEISTLIYQAVGCQYCLHGYQERIGIFELIPMTAHSQNIFRYNNLNDLSSAMRKEGWLSLNDIAQEKVNHGETTFEELDRVLAS